MFATKFSTQRKHEIQDFKVKTSDQQALLKVTRKKYKNKNKVIRQIPIAGGPSLGYIKNPQKRREDWGSETPKKASAGI